MLFIGISIIKHYSYLVMKCVVPVASVNVDLVLLVFVAVCFVVVVCIVLLSYGAVRIIVSVLVLDVVVIYDVNIFLVS
jgi:hypothetical protein